MTRYDRYFWYVLRHKWFVFLECCRAGVPLRGLLHDLSKFRPSEFVPCARHFYGRRARQVRDKTGYYKPTDTGDRAFDFAWLLHQKRSDHHWQWWVLPENGGGLVAIEMTRQAVIEMVCDWKGAARAQSSKASVTQWYQANGGRMILNPSTRRLVESLSSFNPEEGKNKDG